MTMLYSSRRTLLGGVAAGPQWWDPNGEGLCIWSAYQPKDAASLAASYIDLSGNGNNTGPGTAPAWDAVNGWKFDHTLNTFLTTTFTPANDQSQSMIIQFTNHGGAGAGAYMCGTAEAGDTDFFLYMHQAGNQRRYANGDVSLVGGFVAQGNLCVAGNQGYWNGVADGGAIGVYTGIPAQQVTIGRIASGGGFDSTFFCQAFALYDCVLTGPQVLAIVTAMAAL